MKHLILIQCKDQVGLVKLISEILAKYELNITTMREFVDEAASAFFTRIECNGHIDSKEELRDELNEKLPEAAIISIDPPARRRIAVLVTKEHHCLADILTRHYFDLLHGNVCCVIGNYSHLEDFTSKFNIPFHHVSHLEKSKEVFEDEILSVLREYQPDFIVLAKFMRILSPTFVRAFPFRIINIHHSFLPAFIGANPYRKAFDRGVKLIGATAHFVTDDLDEGPIIEQQTVPVNHTFGVPEMVISGREIEQAVLSRALDLVLQDRIFISGNKTIVFH